MGLNIGDKAPAFSLQDTSSSMVSLSNLITDTQAVILFFPLAFTKISTDEVCHVRDNMKMFRALNATVAGISVDSPFALGKFKKSYNLNFRLLSDFNREVTNLYKVLADDWNGFHNVSKQATFVIDDDGLIKHLEVTAGADNLPDFDAILSALMR